MITVHIGLRSKIPPTCCVLFVVIVVLLGPVSTSRPQLLAEPVGTDNSGHHKTHDVATREASQRNEEQDASAVVGRQWGNLRGRFVSLGDRPKPTESDIAKDLIISGKPEYFDRSLVVNRNGGLANVIVFLRTPDAVVNPSLERGLSDSVILRHGEGQFVPRVLPVWGARQTVTLRNTTDSPVFVRIFAVDHSPGEIVPLEAGESFEYRPKHEGRMLQIVENPCRYGMTAYLVVRNNPYVAVTKSDGMFSIDKLPVGKLEFQVWHERTGWLVVRDWVKGRFSVVLSPGDNDVGTIEVPGELLSDRR